jgi:hypothetical protein
LLCHQRTGHGCALDLPFFSPKFFNESMFKQ